MAGYPRMRPYKLFDDDTPQTFEPWFSKFLGEKKASTEYREDMGAVVKRKKSYTKEKRPTKVRKTQRLSHFKAGPGDFQEKKWVDVSATPTFTSTVSTTLLNGMALGSDYFQRDGHNYVNSKLHLRGHILVAGTDGTAVSDTLCVAIVYDRQANGAAPTWAQVFQNTDNAGGLSSLPMAQNNKENSDRFLVLYHKTWNMPPFVLTASVPGAVAPQNPTANWELDVHKTLNLPTRYQGDTAVIGSILSGSIYFMTLGSQATADWQVTFSSRIVVKQ